jgi:hypothetical protein
MNLKKSDQPSPCHLCGAIESLSYEHVPPKSAFNAEAVRYYLGEDLFREDSHASQIHYHEQQKGAGGYTLCKRCNNMTGKHYVPSFADFYRWGAKVLDNIENELRIVLVRQHRPLPIIKEVVTMFASAAPEGILRRDYPDLARFVLDPTRKYLPPEYHFYLYLTRGPFFRRCGGAVRTEIEEDPITKQMVTTNSQFVIEVAHPPFGFLMTVGGSSPDHRLFDFSHWARFDFGEIVETSLKLSVLPITTPLPATY